MRTLRALFVLALAVTWLSACGSGDDKGSEPSTTSKTGGPALKIVDFGFEPSDLEVSAGSVSLDVDNTGAAKHSVTIEDLDVDRVMNPGEKATLTFDAEPGDYEFHCKFHPGSMKGTITVGS